MTKVSTIEKPVQSVDWFLYNRNLHHKREICFFIIILPVTSLALWNYAGEPFAKIFYWVRFFMLIKTKIGMLIPKLHVKFFRHSLPSRQAKLHWLAVVRLASWLWLDPYTALRANLFVQLHLRQCGERCVLFPITINICQQKASIVAIKKICAGFSLNLSV